MNAVELTLMALAIAWLTYEAAKLLLVAALVRRQQELRGKLDLLAAAVAKMIEEGK